MFFVVDFAFDNFLESAKYVKTISSSSGSVRGIATLGDEIFVVRTGTGNASVHVYKRDTDDVTIQRSINVGSGSSSFRGLAACELNQCLYVSESSNQTIHKVSPVTNNTVKRWSVDGQPYGLSVNSAHNLLVAVYSTHIVQEYTTDGEVVRTITLQPDIKYPTHVVQLRDGKFGIIHHGLVNRYCVVGSDGKIVKSTGSGKMSSPYGFVVSEGGKVFVADYGHNRVLLLNSETLSVVKKLPAAFNVSFSTPYCIHFDASARVMYISECASTSRILCFQKCQKAKST